MQMFPFAVGLAGFLVVSQATARETAPISAVYCKHPGGKDVTLFVAKLLPDGRLKYGLEKWQGARLMGATGFAEKQGDLWVSSRNVTPGDPDAGCILRIRLNPAGLTTVKADPSATCVADLSTPDKDSNFDPSLGTYGGGQGTYIDEVLPRRTFMGPVTTELDDIADFFQGPKGLAEKCE